MNNSDDNMDLSKIIDDMEPFEFRIKKGQNFSVYTLPLAKMNEQYLLIKQIDKQENSRVHYYIIYDATKVIGRFDIGYDLFFVDWKIGLGVTIISGLSLLLFKIQLNKTKKYLHDEFEYSDSYSTLVNETAMLLITYMTNIVEDVLAVVIAHTLDSVEDFENIIVIKDGKVSEQGSYGDLIEKKGIYYNLISL